MSGESISKRWTKDRKKKILSSRLLTTKLLFKSLKKHRSLSKVKHIVCASAIGIYESSYYKIFDEESKCEPNTFLQQVVKKWENEIQKFKNIEGKDEVYHGNTSIIFGNFSINVRIARFHNIFGPEGTYDGGKEKVPAAICRKDALSNGEIEVWGDGKQTRSFLFIDECINATRKLMLLVAPL